MEKKYLDIYKNDKGQIQHLSEIYQIESNTIFCKRLTGLGATYSEIKSERDSIIIEPNTPAINGKCGDLVHKKDNLFGVEAKVTVDDITEYLDNTLKKQLYIKIITTPEGFMKVREAFKEIKLDIYSRCFVLYDECHKLIKDVDYRGNIILPMQDFFKFRNKALVSATVIEPSDPRFEDQHFRLVEIQPHFDYKIPINIVNTNNALEALKEVREQLLNNQKSPRSICYFVNSTDMIHQFITKLGLVEESSVFCAKNSVEKLKNRGFKHVYENWDLKNKRANNFFTSRFETSLDIILNENPDIVFVTEPYYAEYTIVDPDTGAAQAVGRFRNGISNVVHIVNTKSSFYVRNRVGIQEYIKGCQLSYDTIRKLYDCATSEESRKAYKAALDGLPYQQFLFSNGETNYFAIDNFIDDELLKSTYNDINSVYERYNNSFLFEPTKPVPFMYKYGDKERLEIEQISTPIKESRKQIVDILNNLKDDAQTEMGKSLINDLRETDPFIVDAFFSVGKEVIENCNYVKSKIKESMILKDYRVNIRGTEFIELLKNSFKVGQCYTCKHIKEELNRLYSIFKIKPQKQ